MRCTLPCVNDGNLWVGRTLDDFSFHYVAHLCCWFVEFFFNIVSTCHLRHFIYFLKF